MSEKPIHLEKLNDVPPIDYDIYSAPSHDYRTFLVDRRLDPIRVKLSDRTIIIGAMRLLANIFICMPLIKRRMPIYADRHFILEGLFSRDNHAQISSIIKDELFDSVPIEIIVDEIAVSMMDMFNINYTHIGWAVCLADIRKIASTILDDRVQEVINVDLEKAIRGGIKEVEDVTKEAEKRADAFFSSPDNAWNIFHAQLVCGSLKAKQFYQSVLHIGPRTDANEDIFPRIIRESFLTGLKDITSLAIESRSGVKANVYQKKKTADTSYLNRLLQINTIGIKKLHRGDCGSEVYREYHIDPRFSSRYEGKHVFHPQTGELVILNKENVKQFEGTSILGRSPLTCSHTDGYCMKCGGEITKNMLAGDHVGMVANVQVGPIVIQISLSAKHLIVAIAAIYNLPNELTDMFKGRGNKLYFDKEFYPVLDDLVIGFQSKDIAKINDVVLLSEDETLNPDYFSRVTVMYIGKLKEDGEIVPISKQITMKSSNDIYPHLSPEALEFITTHPKCIHRDGKKTWISLKGFPKQLPFLQHPIVNDSISKLVSQLNGFFKTDIERFTSVNAATDYIAEFLWDKGFKTNILHIETVIKGFLITSPMDYYPGKVTDPNNVQFRKLGKLIPRRSIGGQLVYEQNLRYFHSAVLSIIPKRDGLFDAFMGYVDQCDPNNTWPLEK